MTDAHFTLGPDGLKQHVSVRTNYQGSGRYRHYKGGEYLVLGLALEEATLLPTVIYRPVDGWPPDVPEAEFWSRPLTDFNAQVDGGPEGNEGLRRTVPRFKRLA